MTTVTSFQNALDAGGTPVVTKLLNLSEITSGFNNQLIKDDSRFAVMIQNSAPSFISVCFQPSSSSVKNNPNSKYYCNGSPSFNIGCELNGYPATKDFYCQVVSQ